MVCRVLVAMGKRAVGFTFVGVSLDRSPKTVRIGGGLGGADAGQRRGTACAWAIWGCLRLGLLSRLRSYASKSLVSTWVFVTCVGGGAAFFRACKGNGGGGKKKKEMVSG